MVDVLNDYFKSNQIIAAYWLQTVFCLRQCSIDVYVHTVSSTRLAVPSITNSNAQLVSSHKQICKTGRVTDGILLRSIFMINQTLINELQYGQMKLNQMKLRSYPLIFCIEI